MKDLRNEIPNGTIYDITAEDLAASAKYYEDTKKMKFAKKAMLEIKHNVYIDKTDDGTYIYSHDPACEYGWKLIPQEWITDDLPERSFS